MDSDSDSSVSDNNNEKQSMAEDFDQYMMIITDRALPGDSWNINDIVKIDDVMHTRSDYFIKMPNLGQGTLFYDNRDKIMAIPRNRGDYVINLISTFMFIPRNLYFLHSPSNDMGGIVDISNLNSASPDYIDPPVSAYTMDNVCIVEHVVLLDTAIFSSNIPPIQAMWSHVIRLIINYAIRGYNHHDIYVKVLKSIKSFMRSESDGEALNTLTSSDLVEVLQNDCQSMITMMIKLMIEFDAFGTIVNTDQIICIIDTIEMLYEYDDIEKLDDWIDRHNDNFSPPEAYVSNKEPIPIGPAIIIGFLESRNYDMATRVIMRFIEHSQLNGVNRYVLTTINSDFERFVNTFDADDPVIRIADNATSIELHMFIRRTWVNLFGNINSQFMGSPFSNNLRRNMKMFEHTINSLYASIVWVIEGTNKPEECIDYVGTIVCDYHVTNSSSLAWAHTHGFYYSNKHDAIIAIALNHLRRIGKNAIDEIAHSIYVDDRVKNMNINQLVTGGAVSAEHFNRAIMDICRGIEYYASLKHCVDAVSKIVQSNANIDGIDISKGLGSHDTSYESWPDWNTYKEIVQTKRFDYCYCGQGDCLAKYKMHAYGGRRFLTCDAFKDFAESLDILLMEIVDGLGLIELPTIKSLCKSLAGVMCYHVALTEGPSHKFDKTNVYNLICTIVLCHALKNMQIYTKYIERVDILNGNAYFKSTLKKVCQKERIHRDKIKIGKSKRYTLTEDVLKYLFQCAIGVFNTIRSESQSAHARLTKDWNSLDSKTQKIMKKTMIYKYGNSDILDKIARTNDSACMFVVILNEIDGMIDPYEIYPPKEFKKSPLANELTDVM